MKALLLLLLAQPLHSQVTSKGTGIMTVNAGSLACGAVRRSSNEVQTYCYVILPSGGGRRLVWNAIGEVNPNTVVPVPYCAGPTVPTCTGIVASQVEWKFTIVGTAINWEVTVQGNGVLPNGSPVAGPNPFIEYGTFATIYGAVPCTRVGFLAGAYPFRCGAAPNPFVQVGGPQTFDTQGYPHNAAYMLSRNNDGCCLPP